VFTRIVDLLGSAHGVTPGEDVFEQILRHMAIQVDLARIDVEVDGALVAQHVAAVAYKGTIPPKDKPSRPSTSAAAGVPGCASGRSV
jgi:hypothetical protein